MSKSDEGNEESDGGGCREDGGMVELKRDLHVQYFNWMLRELPGAYSGEESSRLALAYFAISALDVLGALDQVDAPGAIAWVYSLQVLPVEEDGGEGGGFRGSPSAGIPFCAGGAAPMSAHDCAHLAMTYSALAVLAILGDDFSRVRRAAVARSMRRLQRADGGFAAAGTDAQADLRFVFCAAAVCAMLDDWSGMDGRRAAAYVLASRSHEGGFALQPGAECHGGATYCGLAALWLIAEFDPSSSSSPAPLVDDAHGVVRWCVHSQAASGGFRGRPNKPPDSCYAFWIGGVLHLLGMDGLCDRAALRGFLLSCQSRWGGFSKLQHEGLPDLLHSYYAVCGLSLLGEPGFQPLLFGLGLTARAAGGLPVSRRRAGGVAGLDTFRGLSLS